MTYSIINSFQVYRCRGYTPQAGSTMFVVSGFLGNNFKIMGYNSDHHCLTMSFIFHNNNDIENGFPLTSGQIPPTSGFSDGLN